MHRQPRHPPPLADRRRPRCAWPPARCRGLRAERQRRPGRTRLRTDGHQGKTVKLSDFKGRHVVLEWTNPGCPFVVKHYGSQNMQGLQKEATAKNVVWLSISSTAPGPCRLPGAGRAGGAVQGNGARRPPRC